MAIIDSSRRAYINARLIDPAQMQQRQEDFDFDMMIGRLAMVLSPGEELSNIFGTTGADTPGSANYSGVKHPAIDALIVKVGAAETREEMETAVRALDRVLRSQHIWIPQWYKGSHNIAYWDVFGRPDVKPTFIRGIDYWWWDEAKYQALKDQGALR